MFGYHDSDRCKFDLWSPVDDPNGCAVENRVFSSYAKHCQEIEDVVNHCVDHFLATGETEFAVNLDDDFSDEDLEYIQNEIVRRLA